jgi:hypothetical protein
VSKAKERVRRLNQVAPRSTAYWDLGLTEEATAARLRMSVRQVRRLEASALAKLRGSPILQQAYDKYKEEGMPLMEYMRATLRVLFARPRQEQLLDYQLELFEWSQILDLADQAGFQLQEVERARAAVEQCRRLLLQEMGLKNDGRERERFETIKSEW